MTPLHDEVIEFLSMRNWFSFEQTNNFEYLSNDLDDEEVVIRIPINDKYPDYVTFMAGVLETLKGFYPKSYNHPKSRLKYFLKKLSHIQHKYNKTKKDWIIPEIESKIERISIHDVYIPKKF